MDDMPVYWANAREYFDGRGFSFFFGNASSYDYTTPRIYFQPLTFAMGVLSTTGISPGLGFAVTGLLTATLCARCAISLYDHYSGRNEAHRTAGLVAFFWGGGLIVLGGLIWGLQRGDGPLHVFRFDPGGGQWFQNFGRNLIIATEALYHALFFATVLGIVQRRFALAFAVLAITCISHPFTGVQLLAVCFLWSVSEILFLKNRSVPRWFPMATAFLGILHGWYYLVFLPGFPEQRSIQEQWSLARLLGLRPLVLSIVLVALAVAYRFRSSARLRQVLGDSANRLLVVWFIVSLLLSKHELILGKPMQPLHFTRGYLWIPLFLLGLPALLDGWNRVRTRPSRLMSIGMATAIFTIMLSDNIVWFGVRTAQALGNDVSGFGFPEPYMGVRMTRPVHDMMKWMNRPENRGFVVASNDETVGYLVTAYTPLRSWQSHHYNTPYSQQRWDELRTFFDSSRPPVTWKTLPMMLVFKSGDDWHAPMRALDPAGVTIALQDSAFTVFRVNPRGPVSRGRP